MPNYGYSNIYFYFYILDTNIQKNIFRSKNPTKISTIIMNWKIKATIQKTLSTTRLGDRLNHTSVLLNKNYHSNVFKYQTHECLRKVNDCKIILHKEATALEIGTGYSILSAIVLALLGFKKIITVDITNDLNFSSFRKQIQYLDSSPFLEKLKPKSVYSEKDLIEKIKNIKK